ncbi:primosomal replication protein [Legionella erythra]|uniref:Coiled-coil protein n=1 Tax=Legionella erythra TaxID=448 RepID=A0A0W0TFP4_LEGER|nr:primosomal replication protein [Legionella erythra]KTC94403.1 coiled-coil protein [Legionella erythra]
MAGTVHGLLNELSARLPELEWKLANLHAFNPLSLPKGLFQTANTPDASAFIAEVKKDIDRLARRNDLQSAHFVAERIKQKINVLVSLCQLHDKSSLRAEKPDYTLPRIMTRQQWLQSLEHEMEVLSHQQQALFNRQQKHLDAEAQLALQAELGALEKRLTLLRETYQKAVTT